MIERRACKRCGWVRAVNSRTPDNCTNCKGSRERPAGDADHVEWRQVGLIRRGTVHPPAQTRGT